MKNPILPSNLDQLNLDEEIVEDADLEQLKYEVYGKYFLTLI